MPAQQQPRRTESIMDSVPLRSIMISDFRGLNGTRTLPLDAPIVLLHGPNGAGKTSVLSALELGLTGQIRSMRRQDPRYTAHLPSLGRDFATVRAHVSESFQNSDAPASPLTAGGSRIEGSIALTAEAANFYGERCYLDQASLGRLLELYQHRESREESALARFVNELLGLEQLDALRAGLQDANDLRSLKNLADRLDDAADEAQRATAELAESTDRLDEASAEVDRTRAAASAAAQSLGLSLSGELPDEVADEDLLRAIRRAVADGDFVIERTRLLEVQRDLIALGGRIDAFAARPSTQDLADARDRLDQAEQRLKLWGAEEGSEIQSWQRAVRAAGVVLNADAGADVRAGLDRALIQTRRQLDSQAALRTRQEAARAQIDTDRARLEALQNHLFDAQEHATALVEGLATIRAAIVSESCPVCDRDYSEVDSGHLGAHVDAKVAQLSQQGQRLIDLRRERDQLAATVARDEAELGETAAGILQPSELQNLEQRATNLERLQEAWEVLRPAVDIGRSLRGAVRGARFSVEDLEAASSEEQYARTELARCAAGLGRPAPNDGHSVQAIWADLSEAVDARLGELGKIAERTRTAAESTELLDQALKRHTDAVARVATAAQRKSRWEASVKEGKRRQAVARAVYNAATDARATVVQRVFTHSLNRVWQSVFTRLAPHEGFIPAFGIPTSSKTGLDLTLQTIHRSGGEGGSPQMMLSAGNLNTAALSLFLALHLAVEPVVPCLVLDDPVQAMDEVHVAQFAGLIRVLAKQHERQVIIAVHERELFDYLAFELSPAYEGDELLTIELGERSLDQDGGVTRHVWTPDPAIAG
jgi:exonuclease SbcC